MLDKSPPRPAVNVPNDLAAHWMPFTANRAFKKNPRLLAGAKDMHYITVDGRKIIDAAAGMWCCNAGHGRSQIAEAIQEKVAPQGVGVIIEARHLCMQMRGVEKQCGQAVTSSMLGAFRHDKQTRDEFLSLVSQKRA